MGTGARAALAVLVIALVLFLVLGAAVVTTYFVGWQESAWVNPQAASGGAVAPGDPAVPGAAAGTTAAGITAGETPQWYCAPGYRVLFGSAIFSVTDASGTVHSADVTAKLNTLRPGPMPSSLDSKGNPTAMVVALSAPLTASSFAIDAFAPAAPIVVQSGSTPASAVSANPSKQVRASTAAMAANATPPAAYGIPSNPTVFQYGAEDVTATLVASFKAIRD